MASYVLATKTYKEIFYNPSDSNIFVFGSDVKGRHGKGAALTAVKKWSAIYGVAAGPTGQSYALPTMNLYFKPLPIIEIQKYTNIFLEYAKQHSELTFLVTRIGCGLAGFKDKDICPLFKGHTDNVKLPLGWDEFNSI
jgi:hypothetical protein